MTLSITNLWWGPPKNFAERKHERKISWLELFYDLVYVAAISQLTHHLAEHPSWHEAAYSFLLFALIFWSWSMEASIMICMAMTVFVRGFLLSGKCLL